MTDLFLIMIQYSLKLLIQGRKKIKTRPPVHGKCGSNLFLVYNKSYNYVDILCKISIGNNMTKLLQVISRAIRRVKFETILKYHEWYFTPHITNKSCYYLFFPAGIFPSNHACQAAWWMNQARNMHTASNLYIKLVTPGWPFSCNTGIKVTSAELSNPAHVFRPLPWDAL